MSSYLQLLPVKPSSTLCKLVQENFICESNAKYVPRIQVYLLWYIQYSSSPYIHEQQ